MHMAKEAGRKASGGELWEGELGEAGSRHGVRGG